MTSIRERQKAVLWAFLVIFVLSLSIGGLVGGANLIDQIFGSNLTGNAVASVNSTRINVELLSQAISMYTEQAREQYGELNDMLQDQVETEAWEYLVSMILLDEEIKEHHLEATGDEIYYLLQYYPPQFLQQNEAFLTDGQFDPNLYYQALNNPIGDEWATVEAYLASLLPNEKMANLLGAVTYTSEEEVRSAWYDRNTEATIDYIYVPASRINTDDVVFTEDDLRTIYRRERSNFDMPETRILEYAFWTKTASAEDTLETVERARELIERARAGEDFAQLALDYSEDIGSGLDGGNLGWFGEGQMVSPFEEAAFSAQIGEIVGPVQTQYGYHVIKVEDRRESEDGPEVSARHILLTVEMSPQTLSSLRSQANMFSFDAADSSFDAALRIHGLTSSTSSPLQVADKYLPVPVGMLRGAVRFTFEAEEIGQVSDVLENEQCYLVARLAEIRPKGVQPLEAVRTTVESIARQEAAAEQVSLIMAAIQQQLVSGMEWQAVADSFPEAIYNSGITARLNGSFSGIGSSPILKGLLKAIEPGQVSDIVKLERGEVIVRLVELSETDWEQYALERENEHLQLLTQRLGTIWNTWMNDLESQARIVDNRYLYY